MDVGTARALLSLLQAAAAAPSARPAQPNGSGSTRKRCKPEEAAAAMQPPVAPQTKQPRLDSSAPRAAAEEAGMPLPGVQSSSQLALVLQLSGSQQQHGAVPPKVAAVLSALPLAKKQELLLALLRKQTQGAPRAQPLPQALVQPQPQQAVPLLPTPTQPHPTRPLLLPPPQPRAAPLQQRQQQQRRQLQHAPAALKQQPQQVQLSQRQQVASGPMMGVAGRQQLPPDCAPGQMPIAPVRQAQQQPTALPAVPPGPHRQLVRPTPCRGSPSITQPLFLRVVQERALGAARTCGM